MCIVSPKFTFFVVLLCCTVGCELDTKVNVHGDGSGTIQHSITFASDTPEEQVALLKSALRKDDDTFGEGVEFQKLDMTHEGERITLTGTYKFADINRVNMQGNPIGNPFNIWVGVPVIPKYDFHLEMLTKQRRKLTITAPHEAFTMREAAGQRKLFSRLLEIIDTKLTAKAQAERAFEGLGEGDSASMLPNLILNGLTGKEQAKMKDALEELVITKSVTVAGKTVETNAQYMDGSTVILHKVDYGWLLQNRSAIEALAQNEPPSLAEAKSNLSRLEGLRLNLEPTITVVFDVPATPSNR
jgi:hypothetical protein